MADPHGQAAVRQRLSVLLMVLGFTFAAPLQAQPQPTVEQRLARIEERLARIEERQKATEERLTEGFKAMNQRIDDLRDDINRRFVGVDQRFDVLTKVIVGFMSAVTAFTVVLIGITFWFAKQYKPVAEPRVEWTERELVSLKERVLRLEGRLDAISKATA